MKWEDEAYTLQQDEYLHEYDPNMCTKAKMSQIGQLRAGICLIESLNFWEKISNFKLGQNGQHGLFMGVDCIKNVHIWAVFGHFYSIVIQEFASFGY